MKTHSLILFFSCILLVSSVDAQIVINEFMASNSTTISDDAGEFDDWIEIYNTTNTEISLGQYYISDNFSNPVKFNFDGSATIPPNGYYLIFADEDGSQGPNHANFKLDREAEEIGLFTITGGDTIFVDSVRYTNQSTDLSYGRYPDGSPLFELFSTPTPGAENISDNIIGVAPNANFTLPGGFYSTNQTLDITCTLEEAEIRYTLDGSDPHAESSLYSNPIDLDRSVVVRARVFAENHLPGPIQTHTYFIDEHFVNYNATERLPVISITAADYELWSDEAGLLNDVNNQNNWEKAANIEYFSPEGIAVINQVAGIKLFGNSSRRMEQKSLAVIARNEYGNKRFNYPLFKDRPFEEYKSFVLRNAGNDWSQTYFRDALSQELVRNTMDIDAQGNTQAVLYVNGEFYGITNMKEKINEHYLEAHHNIDPDNFDMLQDNATPSGYGDGEAYESFRGFVVRNQMDNPILYQNLEGMMDIQEYMNLYIAQIYLANIDMSLNQKFWRERENYAKWRWIIYDTEMGFGQGDYSYTDAYGTLASDNTLAFATYDYGGAGWPFLRPWSSEKIISILRNTNFRNSFIQTFAAHLNTTFHPDKVKTKIDSMAQNIRNYMPQQIDRYGGMVVGFNPYGNHFTTMDEWEDHVDTVYNFARQRTDYMRLFMEYWFELNGSFQLTPVIQNPESGDIFIQGIKMPLDSANIFFDDIPIQLEVKPKQGYKFTHWKGLGIDDSLSSKLEIVSSDDMLVEAIFEPEDELVITEIFYNPTLGDNYEFIEIYNPKHSTTFNLGGFSISGDIMFTFPETASISPGSYLIVAADITLFSNRNIDAYQWASGNLGNSEGLIKIFDDSMSLMDSVYYTSTLPWPGPDNDRAIQLISTNADNNMGENWISSLTDNGSPGIPYRDTGIEALIINEFQSANDDFVADEYNEYNDWIEIYNPGPGTINIAGLFVTNDLSAPGMWQIPTNNPASTIVRPGEYKLLWADKDTLQGALHLNFNLNKSGSQIGISADGITFIDSLTIDIPLSENTSYGRYADASDDWRVFDRPTPRYKNSLPPEIVSEPVLYVDKRTDYEYEIIANDPEGDEVLAGIYELPSWLYFSGNDAAPRIYGRSPTSNFNPTRVKVFVTDGYSGLIEQEFTITLAQPEIFTNLASKSFKLYPNPSSGLITIESEIYDDVILVEVINMAGQVVGKENLNQLGGSKYSQLDLSHLMEGVYFINLITDEGIQTQKMVLY